MQSFQVFISVIGTAFMGYLSFLIRQKFIQKKAHDKKMSDGLNALIKYQETHMMETMEMNNSFKAMQKDLILTRVDASCAVYALRRASNGNKFAESIDEERKRLMIEFNFKYKD